MSIVIASPAQQAARRETCNNCEFKVVHLGMDVCSKCKCPLGGKVVLILAKCPTDKWPKL